ASSSPARYRCAVIDATPPGACLRRASVRLRASREHGAHEPAPRAKGRRRTRRRCRRAGRPRPGSVGASVTDRQVQSSWLGGFGV
ncbi:hypothetical protein GS506_24095, partial [Rhodococcus hoagii]|nr:hypothetical protein [Prescottella equi]